jgi:NACHT domain
VHDAGPSKSGFFAGAVGADVRYGNFTEYNFNTYENRSSANAEMKAKLKPVDRSGYYVPRCMDGTREYIFEEIDKWLDNVNEPNILWLSGGPGAGKSTIASSMVSKLKVKRGRLCSFFFFRREDVELSDPAVVWRTVAYDLTQRNPDFFKAVTETLNEGKVDLQWPDIDLHFKFLIGEPLAKLHERSIPPVIVIDALDECGSDPSQSAQRKAFLDTLIQWSDLPKTFKLIVTGRDDRVLDSLRASCKHIVLLTGVNVSVDANKDIRLFFEKRFADVGGSLFPEWPGERILNNLTRRAAGLFIWADTIMKFLEQGIPDEQLELIFRGNMGDGDNLTRLYHKVLILSFQGVTGRALEMYKLVVSAVVLAKTPFHPGDLPEFLSQSKSSIKFILDKLASVVSVGATDKRLRICHLSFVEFLCDPKRCPEQFFIDRQEESRKLTMWCFKRMKERLKFNICNLETSDLLNDEVEDLADRIKTRIPGSLIYSCRFWAAHLQDTTDAQDGHEDLLKEIKDFLYNRFLFWLEVMSLVKEVLAANAALVTSIPWIGVSFSSVLILYSKRFLVGARHVFVRLHQRCKPIHHQFQHSYFRFCPTHLPISTSVFTFDVSGCKTVQIPISKHHFGSAWCRPELASNFRYFSRSCRQYFVRCILS